MINNLFIFGVALFMIIRGSTMATKWAERLSENFHLSKYTVGFIVVAIISVLPEIFVVISSSVTGVSVLGLGTVLGASVADLTLIFAIIVFWNGRSLKVESRILKNHMVYPLMLILPLVLGLNGYYSRLDGLALIIAGGIFYYLTFRNGGDSKNISKNNYSKLKSVLGLFFSMVILLIGSYFIITSATILANYFGVNPILIGMFVVGIGTTMPELFFSLKSLKEHDDSLAIGDILGTVLADVTIVVGILALINPFSFPQKLIYITGVFLVVSSFILFYFMKTGHKLNKKEAFYLFLLWIVFAVVEFFVNS